MPQLFDVIETIIDLPTENVRAGMQGAIVETLSDTAFLVEFANEYGETVELASLTVDQFIIVWHNATREWTPLAEQAAAVVAKLPDEAAREVLDFARFLAVKRQQTVRQAEQPMAVGEFVPA
jgi:hypothetical protein